MVAAVRLKWNKEERLYLRIKFNYYVVKGVNAYFYRSIHYFPVHSNTMNMNCELSEVGLSQSSDVYIIIMPTQLNTTISFV